MTTLPDVKRLSSLNDPLLSPLFEARSDAERDAEIERLVLMEVNPLIRRVLAGMSGPMLRPEDVDDVTATVDLRLVERLQRAAVVEDAAITSLAGFAATLTFRAVYQLLRRLAPERTRLQNSLRYILRRDRRLAVWRAPAGIVAGRAEWAGRDPVRLRWPSRSDATPAMLDRTSPADAVTAIVDRIGSPVPFADLIALMAELWGVDDRPDVALVEPAGAPAGPLPQIESREFLTALWEEIRELPRPQRVALLLNLREGRRSDVLAVLVLAGITTIDDIAAVLEMPAERLADLWSALPLDDRTIASLLGVTRQQVINLRKSGRERLARRMKRARGGR